MSYFCAELSSMYTVVASTMVCGGGLFMIWDVCYMYGFGEPFVV